MTVVEVSRGRRLLCCRIRKDRQLNTAEENGTVVRGRMNELEEASAVAVAVVVVVDVHLGATAGVEIAARTRTRTCTCCRRCR